MSRRAFTMIELLVVIAIIGILLAMVRPMLSGASNQTREMECASRLQQMAVAMHAYDEDYGSFPANLRTLDSILQDREVLTCPRTGSQYYYHAPKANASRNSVVAACVSPRKKTSWPHGGGDLKLELTAGGEVRKVRK